MNRCEKLTWYFVDLTDANKFDKIAVLASNPEFNHRLPSRIDGPMAEVHELLYKCKDIAKRTKSHRPTERHLNDSPRESFPPQDVADALTRLYFQNFESTYRILHIPSFQNDYEQFRTDRNKIDDGTLNVILLVMAIGACFFVEPAKEVQVRADAQKWVYAAQAWLSDPVGKRRLSIIGLQVHCLLVLARQTNLVGADLVWISMGSLVRTAIHMGLHRDPNKYPKLSPFHAELRRRLWATVAEMAVQSSLDDGMPPMISFEDFDTLAPGNIADVDILESTKDAPNPKPDGTFTQTSLQIDLLKSLRTRLEVARLINHFRSNPTYEDVLRLSSNLSEVLREHALRTQNYLMFTRNEKPTMFHRNLMEHLLRRFLLALHRPFGIKARKDPRYYFSRKVCLEQALMISSPHTDNDFSRLMAIGGGIFREIMTHCALTVGLELITQLQEDERNMTLQRNRLQRQPLHDAIRRILDLSKDRLRLGETNVKGLLFLSMALGQAESMEAGTSQEDGILNAAKQSVVTGFEILKSRLPSDTADGSSPRETSQLEANAERSMEQDGQDPAMDLVLGGADLGLNFEEASSWLFPAFDEISWAPGQWDSNF